MSKLEVKRLAVDPVVQDMLNDLKDVTGKSHKRIILELVTKLHDELVKGK